MTLVTENTDVADLVARRLARGEPQSKQRVRSAWRRLRAGHFDTDDVLAVLGDWAVRRRRTVQLGVTRAELREWANTIPARAAMTQALLREASK